MDNVFCDSRLIRDNDFGAWQSQLNGLVNNQTQAWALSNFFESCDRLRQRRAEAHAIAIQFYETGRLNSSTMKVQSEYYYRTEVFFQGYYSCLSQLANVVNHFRNIFQGISTTSNSKFLSSMKNKYPELDSSYAVLEEARVHRAFLDHPVSNGIASWMTTPASPEDGRVLSIVHFGKASASGRIPDYAIAGSFGPVKEDWHKVTPSYFEIESHLKILIQIVIKKIAERLQAKAS